jgi:hypothetical protein
MDGWQIIRLVVVRSINQYYICQLSARNGACIELLHLLSTNSRARVARRSKRVKSGQDSHQPILATFRIWIHLHSRHTPIYHTMHTDSPALDLVNEPLSETAATNGAGSHSNANGSTSKNAYENTVLHTSQEWKKAICVFCGSSDGNDPEFAVSRASRGRLRLLSRRYRGSLMNLCVSLMHLQTAAEQIGQALSRHNSPLWVGVLFSLHSPLTLYIVFHRVYGGGTNGLVRWLLSPGFYISLRSTCADGCCRTSDLQSIWACFRNHTTRIDELRASHEIHYFRRDPTPNIGYGSFERQDRE